MLKLILLQLVLTVNMLTAPCCLATVAHYHILEYRTQFVSCDGVSSRHKTSPALAATHLSCNLPSCLWLLAVNFVNGKTPEYNQPHSHVIIICTTENNLSQFLLYKNIKAIKIDTIFIIFKTVFSFKSSNGLIYRERLLFYFLNYTTY